MVRPPRAPDPPPRAYPALDPDAARDNPGERIWELERALDSPEARRIAPALPLARAEFETSRADPGQINFFRTILDRLGKLGYLARLHRDALWERHGQDPSAMAQHPLFKAAIEMFQSEAGIVVDGWCGPQTWDALQSLYCFEGAKSELGRHARTGAGAPCEAARLRAVLLRLDALGLSRAALGAAPLQAVEALALDVTAATPADTVIATIRRALVDPLNLLRYVLRTLEAGTGAESDTSLMDLVLDFDRLSERLSRGPAYPLVAGRVTPDPDHPGGTYLLKSFIGRILTIEMWMLGRDVSLRGPSTASDDAAFTTLRRAIKAFLAELRASPAPAGADRATALQDGLVRVFGSGRDRVSHTHMARHFERYYPEILQGIQLVLANAAHDREVSRALAERSDWSAEFSRVIEDAASRFRSRLWDGVKRAIGWVWRLLRRGVGALLDVARKVVRVVFAFSAEALNAARDAIFICKRGLDHFLQRDVRGPFGALVSVRDSDFDYRIIARTEDGAALRKDARLLKLRARAFALASHLLASIIWLARKVVPGLRGSWIGVSLALLHASRRARRLARWLARVRALRSAFDGLHEAVV